MSEPKAPPPSSCPVVAHTWLPVLLSCSLFVVGLLPAVSLDLRVCVPVALQGVHFGCCLIGGFVPYFLLLSYFRSTGQGGKSFAFRSFLLFGWSNNVHVVMYQGCACFQLVYVASALSYLVHLLRGPCTFPLAYVEAALLLLTLVLIVPFVVWKWVTFFRHSWKLDHVYAAMSSKFGVDAEERGDRIRPVTTTALKKSP